MLDWAFLVSESALASVVPDEHAHLRRPIAGALAEFLGGLPQARQAAILAQQAALPPDAPLGERLGLLARCCPTLHKVGQLLARDHRLSEELRRHFQELESLPPAVPHRAIESVLAEELGPLNRIGVALEPPALAEASVAVVIPFREGKRRGVFKVLKPGVVERLEEELGLFDRVGAYLDQRCDDFRLPHLDYQETFEQVRDKLRHEVRFDREQDHLGEAREAYRGDPRVLIPALFDHCTPRVTAMERVTGAKVTDALGAFRPQTPGHGLGSKAGSARLAGLVVEAVIARPFFSRATLALFHGDPHPGNLFFTDDGRLALLDWSQAGRLGEHERVTMAQVTLAALTLDAGRIVGALEGLAQGRGVDRPALESAVHSRLARLRRGGLPGFTWLLGLLDEAIQAARLRVATDLILFRKALHTLEGVVADVSGADTRPPWLTDAVLWAQFFQHMASEWPWRWAAQPASREFPTRVSNADLVGLMVGLPWAVARWWLDPFLRLPGVG